LLEETYDITLNGARDQDVVDFFAGLAGNKKSKTALIDLFKKNYDGVAFLNTNLFHYKTHISLFSCTNDSRKLPHHLYI
jgi:hypothetical protein